MAGGLRQSKEWGRYLSGQGWEIAEVKSQKSKCKVFIRRIPLLGSVVKIQRPETIPPIETINSLAKKHRALFVKLEPLLTINYELLTSHGFTRDSSPNLPTKTLIIDLTKSEEKLWRNLSQDARQSIRKAEGNQLSVISYRGSEIGEQLKKFHQLLKETGRRQNFWTPSFAQLKAKVEVFGINAVLFLAFPTKQPNSRITEQPVAGALNLIHDGISYGHLSASSNEGRKLYAPYFLMWEIIKRTKGLGLKAFDLEGIYDSRYHKFTKSWQGFTLFKRKFGGKEVTYPQPLIKYYHPLVKLLFKLGSLLD